MSEQDKGPRQTAERSSASGERHGRHRCCGRRRGWVKLAVLVVVLGGVAAWHIWGHDHYRGFGHDFSHASGGHETDVASVRKQAEDLTEHMLERVDASVVQRQKALAIARAAADDLQPLLEAHRATRASLYTALTADTIDPARLEQLRGETLQRADAVSRRLTRQIAELAAVLTPAQRRELLARWAPRLGA